MLQFLSSEWLQAFDDVLRADGELAARFEASPIAIAQEVAADDVVIRYVVVLDAAGGRVEVESDARAVSGIRADVTFVCDRETAAGLARGELNAQRALTSGQLKLRGDVDRLAAAGRALAGLGDVLAELRANTEF